MRGHPSARAKHYAGPRRYMNRYQLPARVNTEGPRGTAGPCGGDVAAPFGGTAEPWRCDVCERPATIHTEGDGYFCPRHFDEDVSSTTTPFDGGAVAAPGEAESLSTGADWWTASQLIAQLVAQVALLEAQLADADREIGQVRKACGL